MSQILKCGNNIDIERSTPNMVCKYVHTFLAMNLLENTLATDSLSKVVHMFQTFINHRSTSITITLLKLMRMNDT